MQKRIAAAVAMLLCVFTLWAGGAGTVVHAENETPKNSFSGDVTLLKQDNSNYVMQVTVENRGEDFSGTVQVILASSNGDGNCAYNTEVTLPAQGKKQFTFTATEKAVDTNQSICALNFLDEKGNLLQSISLKDIYGKTVSGITVGILSDHYEDLTYMDGGGMDLYIRRGGTYPVQLVELDKDNLRGYLDGLYFLLIDQFNVSALEEEDIRAIEDWVRDGGWLIIGTGAYGDQTLSGFDKSFLDISVTDVSEPGEGNAVAVNADRQGFYYSYNDAGIDFTRMAVAELDFDVATMPFYENGENPALYGSVGDGAVAVYYFSFGEEELQALTEYAIEEIYSSLMYTSNSYNSIANSSDIDDVGQNALAFIDHRNTNVDFTMLEIMIGVYVVLAGPVLYLILRKCRKSEWYWVGAPVLGLCFIGVVFFLGRTAKVNEAKVYSVTAQRVDGNQADTYFLAYQSGVEEWKLYLDEDYQAAGPGWSRYYRYSANVNNYYYTVSNDSKGLAIGIKPGENFESGFLYAGKKTESKGQILGGNIRCTGVSSGISGTVTNETAFDMPYMAVWADSYVMVFSDVKAGETLDLQQAFQDGRCVYHDNVSYFYNLLSGMVGYYSSTRQYDQEDMAALLIGMGVAKKAKPSENGYAIVVGVVEDYEKAVADKCSEISYGCLYSYIETGVNSNAAN